MTRRDMTLNPSISPRRATSPRHAARRSRTDEKIADAVLGISHAEGIRAVTIEAVAEYAGVAKTTIYRRYKNYLEMLTGVLDQLPLTSPEEPELTQQGLIDLLRGIQEAFHERMGLAMIGSLLTGDEEFVREWRDRVIAPHTDALQQYFMRGVEAGVLAADLDQDLMHELILGGLIMEDTLHGDVPGDWPERMVTTLWPVLRAD